MAAMRLTVEVGAALVLAALGGFPVLTLGLVLPEPVAWMLAFVVGAILAAIGATWSGHILALDRSGPRLGRVAGTTIITGVLLAALASNFAELAPSRAIALGTGSILLAAAAGLSAEGSRVTRRRLGGDAATTFALLGLAVALVLGALWATPRLYGLVKDSPQILLSDEEDDWCRLHMVEVLLAAQQMGLGSDDLSGAPAPERIGGSLTYDEGAVLEWMARRPGDFQRSCRAAYESR